MRRLVAAAERLHGTAANLRKWAAGYLPGTLPMPLQRIIDAADDYEKQLDEYEQHETQNQEQEVSRR